MKHFQFWHADPPEDVLNFMNDVQRDAPEFEYVRFDQQSGREFVAAHYGGRAVAVWDRLALPAMRADFLRLLLMDTYGGLYTDATYRFIGNVADLVATAPTAQMPLWLTLLNNNYLMFREPGHPFIRACIMMLMDNVEHRRFGSALMATGPGLINSVRCVVAPGERPGIMTMGTNDAWMGWGWMESVETAERLIKPDAELVAAYHAITLVPLDDLGKYAVSMLNSSHRKRPDYWHNWKGSIYL